MRNIIILAVVGFAIAGSGSKLANKLAGGNSGSADRTAAKPAPAAPPSRSSQANMFVVPSDRTGHFRVNAVIGGRSLEFLVDTGASIIALTKKDADRLGLNPSPREFTALIQTANGVVRAAKVRLGTVSVGGLDVSDVEAVVMPNGALAQNLLGMSYLSRLKRFEFRTGQLVLEQ